MSNGSDALIDACDGCGKLPTPIKDYKGKETWYVMVDRATGDYKYLMSNFRYAFKLAKSKLHPVSKEEMYLCEKCFMDDYYKGDCGIEQIGDRSEHDEGEEWKHGRPSA